MSEHPSGPIRFVGSHMSPSGVAVSLEEDKGDAAVISMARLNTIMDVNKDEKTATCQPGVLIQVFTTFQTKAKIS